MFNFLNIAIGWVMKLCYSISFNNYIVALFFFALVMQIILFPLGIKQQKSSMLMAKIRPKIKAIENQYRGRNDRITQQKMQQELQELYQKEGYSPMAGCLPLLIQLPIIFALFGVVRAPLTYTTDLDKTSIGESGYSMKDFYQHAYKVIDNQIAAYEDKKASLEEAKKAEGADTSAIDAEIKTVEGRISDLKNTLRKDSNGTGIMYVTDAYRELKLIGFMKNGVDTFISDFTVEGKFEAGGEDFVQVLNKKASLKDLKEGSFTQRLILKQDAVNAYEGKPVYDFNDMLADKGIYTPTEGVYENGAKNLPNFDFIGETSTLDQPSLIKFNWLLLVPILVFLSSYWSGEITRKLTAAGQPSMEGQPNPNNSGFMRWGMPLMSTYFSLTFPAAIGIYWIFRSVVMVGQQFVLSKMYPLPVYTEEEMKAAVTEEKKAKKRKKIVTIEVDEDDTSYDDLAISEERAEKLRRRHERQLREEQAGKDGNEDKSAGGIDKPDLKDD